METPREDPMLENKACERTLSTLESLIGDHCKDFIFDDERNLIIKDIRYLSGRVPTQLSKLEINRDIWVSFKGKVIFIGFMIYSEADIDLANYLWDLFDEKKSLEGCTFYKDEEFDDGKWSTRKVFGRHKIGPYDQKR